MKIIFEVSDLSLAQKLLSFMGAGEPEGVSSVSLSSAVSPTIVRSEAISSTTPPAPAPAAPPAPAPAAPPAPPAPPAPAPAAPPAPAPAAPPAPPAPAPAAPPAPPAPAPAAQSASKEELIKRMGVMVSQGLPVTTIRSINVSLSGQANTQALPDDKLGEALAQYEAAFAAHKGA